MLFGITLKELAALVQQPARTMIRSALKNSRKLVVTHLMNLTDTLDSQTMKTVTWTRVSRALRTMSQLTKRTSPRRQLSVVQTLQGSFVRWMKMTVVQWRVMDSF